MRRYMDRVRRSGNYASLKLGLPMLGFCAIASYGLGQLIDGRYRTADGRMKRASAAVDTPDTADELPTDGSVTQTQTTTSDGKRTRTRTTLKDDFDLNRELEGLKRDIDWSTYTIQRVPRPNEPVQDTRVYRANNNTATPALTSSSSTSNNNDQRRESLPTNNGATTIAVRAPPSSSSS